MKNFDPRALLKQAALRQKKRERWLAKNKAAIVAYNEHLKKLGVFGDEVRTF